MKKQTLPIIAAVILATVLTGCSAASTNTAANVSNKTNPSVPINNTNGGAINNGNGGSGTSGANTGTPR